MVDHMAKLVGRAFSGGGIRDQSWMAEGAMDAPGRGSTQCKTLDGRSLPPLRRGGRACDWGGWVGDNLGSWVGGW